MGGRRRCGNYSTLLFTFRFGSVAIGSRVDLDSVSTDLFAGFYLIVFRIDEEAYMDASILKAFDGLQNFLFVRHDIETTFCGSSSLFSGTKQASSGRNCSANATMAGVTAISKLSFVPSCWRISPTSRS